MLLLFGYYALLVAIFATLSELSPWLGDRLSRVPRDVANAGLDLTRVDPITDSAGEALVGAFLTMTGALLLVLPVVWVYTVARHKRGFQQSLAQTLVILPIVVAVVVLLVKHSVALAFSLGGIVGAVAFRHRLEDTKDAVYIFVTIAVGLAVGVQAYSVAFAASLFFNLVVIGLWLTDFARVPGHLLPALAARRVLLAKELAPSRQTNEYVAHLDQQLLQSMTPEQLKALADRALERNEEYARTHDDRPVAAAGGLAALQSVVEIRIQPESGPGARATADVVLGRDAKQWRFDAETIDDNGQIVLRYQVRCRRKMPPVRLQETLSHALATLDADVTVR